MAKIIKAVFTRGNDVDLTLSCGHEDFVNISGSAPAPSAQEMKEMEGTEHECLTCNES